MIQADVIREHQYEEETRAAFWRRAVDLTVAIIAVMAVVSLFRSGSR
jgi:hypothetical protein